jgi:hypothetical protein
MRPGWERKYLEGACLSSFYHITSHRIASHRIETTLVSAVNKTQRSDRFVFATSAYLQYACESFTWIVLMVENKQITCRLCFQARRESILVIYMYMYLTQVINRTAVKADNRCEN